MEAIEHGVGQMSNKANGPRLCVLVRFGEIFIKKGNRPYFVQKLLRNLQFALRDLPWKVRAIHGRYVAVPLPSEDEAQASLDLEEVVERLSKVFGVISVSPALQVNPDADELMEAGLILMRDAHPPRTATFRVHSHRSDKRLPFTGGDLNCRIGAAICEEFGLKVNLGNPDLTLDIEAGKDMEHTFLSVKSLPGPGGLPVGVSGRALLLLSGGIDSPVAGYLASKRGLQCDAIYFHSFPYTGDAAKEKVMDLVRALAPYGGSIKLHIVPFTKFQLAVRDNCSPALAVLLYRRMMIRIACKLARELKSKALITGESLGQVASQTLDNMACIEAEADRPILRPLITYDKQEAVDLAQKIGTFSISIRPFEDCCSLFVPRHPEIKGKLKVLLRAEQLLDLPTLEAEALEGIEVWEA